jgi:hypothetical protein
MGNVSANTETTVCIIGCSGETINVVPSHPVFSDLTGGTVTQMNLVELGGQNGVYS